MTEINNNKLMELVIEKHNKFLGAFNAEFSVIEDKLNVIKKQSDEFKKEIETKEARINVLNEKYFLLFHQAKKQRIELFDTVAGQMRKSKSAIIHEIIRLSSRIEEKEKKLQNSRNIDEEDKTIAQIKTLLIDFEAEAKKAGIIVTSKTISDKLDEANASHKELISLQSQPAQDINSVKEFDKQIQEFEERHNWLKRRVESHSSALAYWEKQKGGIKVDRT